MAKKEELFWLGVGVITINGKDYGAEKPLPVDEINTPDLKKMKKDGRVGAKIAVVSAGCNGCKGHLETIEAKNILLVKAKEDVERLTAEAKEAADLKAAHVKAHADKAAADKAATNVSGKTEKKDDKK